MICAARKTHLYNWKEQMHHWGKEAFVKEFFLGRRAMGRRQQHLMRYQNSAMLVQDVYAYDTYGNRTAHKRQDTNNKTAIRSTSAYTADGDRLALAALVTFPLSMVCMALTMVISGKNFQTYDPSRARMNSAIVEYIEGIEVIKAFGRAGVSYEKYARADGGLHGGSADRRAENRRGVRCKLDLEEPRHTDRACAAALSVRLSAGALLGVDQL